MATEQSISGRVVRCDSIYDAEDNFKRVSLEIDFVTGDFDPTGFIVEIRNKPEGFANPPKPSREELLNALTELYQCVYDICAGKPRGDKMEVMEKAADVLRRRVKPDEKLTQGHIDGVQA